MNYTQKVTPVIPPTQIMLEEMTTIATHLCQIDGTRVAQMPEPCINYTDGFNATPYDAETDEAVELQRVVSTVVPVFFGIIGFSGLLGNALVVLGKCTLSHFKLIIA